MNVKRCLALLSILPLLFAVLLISSLPHKTVRSHIQGRYVTQATCVSPCQNGGTCTAPNTCTCDVGWTGMQCETATCVIPCQNGGTCTAPNTCTCDVGWTGMQCETAINCGDPEKPANGQSSFFGTTYNSVVTYTCDVGYTLQGTHSRTCQSSGLWSGSVPQCNNQHGMDTENMSHDQLNAISKFCARHPELKGMKSNSTHMSNLYRHLLHVDAYKLLYCFVPKAGCSTVKVLVESLAGVLGNKTGSSDTDMYVWREKVHGPWERNLSLFNNSLKPAEIELILNSYYKFMILRDPVERLLSAYKNKLEVPLSPIRVAGHNSSIRRSVLYSLKNRLKRPFEDVRLEQDGLQFQVVPFEDYLHFLHQTPLEALDMHFMPMYHMCNPCVVPYNFYSNFRTMTKDIQHVLKQIGAPLLLYKQKMEHPQVEMKDFMDLYLGQMPSAEREQLKQQLSKRAGYTFEAAPSKDIPRQLLKEVFMKYSADFDLYYSLFPDAEKVHKRYLPELDL